MLRTGKINPCKTRIYRQSDNMASRAGSPNKNKAFLLKTLQKMYGDDFNPVIKMAENAVILQAMADADSDPQTRKSALEGWDKVANYVEPKLKAVDHTSSDGSMALSRIELITPKQ
jgi:hypothetical protein